MKRASIDIGSNTVLLLIGEFNESPFHFTEILNETRVTSLGKDLDKTGFFDETSIEETFEALSFYRDKLIEENIPLDQVIVTATEASRVASNAQKFFERVKSELGFHVSIINAEGEAYYTSLGVVKGHSLVKEKVVIMDIGGASTELILIKKEPFEIEKTISLPVGSVRGTDWMKEGTFDQKMDEILSKNDLDIFESDYLLCVAGSMTSLAGMIGGLTKFDSNKVNGSAIEFSKFQEFFNSIDGRDSSELLEKFPFLGKRAKSILAGAKLGLKMGERLKTESFEVSTYGLRYGTLFSGSIEEKYGKF